MIAELPMSSERQVIKKISHHLLWFLFLLFVVSFLDRINIGFAGLTMMKDLGLTSTQFGFATTLFYVAYIACGMLLYMTYWFPTAYRARANALFMIAMPVTAAGASAVVGAASGPRRHGGSQGLAMAVSALRLAVNNFRVGRLSLSPRQATGSPWLTENEKITLQNMLVAEVRAGVFLLGQ